MSYVARSRITATTDTSSGVTAYSTTMTGRIINVIYYTGTLTTTADITMTVEGTSQPIFSSTGGSTSRTIAPRQVVHDTTGGTVLVTTSSSLPVRDYIAMANDRVKCVVVNGGSVKEGTFDIIVG